MKITKFSKKIVILCLIWIVVFNEVALMNGNTSAAKCLAYAQITPAVNVTSADSLQIDWQITVSGS